MFFFSDGSNAEEPIEEDVVEDNEHNNDAEDGVGSQASGAHSFDSSLPSSHTV